MTDEELDELEKLLDRFESLTPEEQVRFGELKKVNDQLIKDFLPTFYELADLLSDPEIDWDDLLTDDKTTDQDT